VVIPLKKKTLFFLTARKLNIHAFAVMTLRGIRAGLQQPLLLLTDDLAAFLARPLFS
jgi:hypothetical protein